MKIGETSRLVIVLLLWVILSGCAYYSVENENVRAYDQTKYFEDEALGSRYVILTKDVSEGTLSDILNTIPNDSVSLQVNTNFPNILILSYLLRSSEWHFIDTAYMDGKELVIKQGRRSTKSNSSDVWIEEYFSVAIPIEDAIEGSCKDEIVGLSLAFTGDYRRNLNLKVSTLQGVLKKADDMKITEIDGNCFDFTEKKF